jgi:hypothetical protein
VAVDWVEADLGAWEPGEPVDLVACTHFLDRDLVPKMRRAVAPGGLVVLEMLTTERVDGPPPRYRVDVGETLRWFVDWRVLRYEETGDGLARLVARRP